MSVFTLHARVEALERFTGLYKDGPCSPHRALRRSLAREEFSLRAALAVTVLFLVGRQVD
jgi:hypothetical protein